MFRYLLIHSLLFYCLVGLCFSCRTKPHAGTTQKERRQAALPLPAVARGNEPFWLLQIPDSTTVLWERPGRGIDTFRIFDRAWQNKQWKIQARNAAHHLEVVFSPRQCSDGMSDRLYPFSVEVLIFDSKNTHTPQHYKGCGE
ncbi:COG3650 family protein [Thermonema rossianum]|uniref:COG3650 family protein n=1 Tax=Thermonema rossianum TaxID=55505 RepID=UPI00056E2A79|nr:hypothetical protein [Thermonema rossianum]